MLNFAQIANLVFATPSMLSEQNEIMDFLTSQTKKLERIITTVRQGIAKLREYRTALISAAVTGKIDVRDLGTG